MADIRIPLEPATAQFGTSTFPQYKRFQGTNFPVDSLSFDAGAQENAFWKLQIPGYASTPRLEIVWYADTASTGNVLWGCQVAAIQPETDTTDPETEAFATAQTVLDSHLGTVGQRLHLVTLTITNTDSMADGSVLWLKLYRAAADASDTMAGDAQVVIANFVYSTT